MLTVSAADFRRNCGRCQDEALKQPLPNTRNGRDRLMVLSVEEYQRLRKRDRSVFKTEDLSEAELNAISESRMDSRHDHMNAELE